MQPDILVSHNDRQQDGLSTIPDYPNTLNRQSSSTNNAPWDLLRIPITSAAIKRSDLDGMPRRSKSVPNTPIKVTYDLPSNFGAIIGKY